MAARGGGSIIFTSSFVGYSIGMPGMAAYAAAKAGLIGLSQVLATELGKQRIRVNSILPGGTDTPATSLMLRAPTASSGLRRKSARAQADGEARRNRAVSAIPCLERLELRLRHRAPRGWWGFHRPNLIKTTSTNRPHLLYSERQFFPSFAKTRLARRAPPDREGQQALPSPPGCADGPTGLPNVPALALAHCNHVAVHQDRRPIQGRGRAIVR